MTAAIETDRFKAKTKSKEAYIVIEKTKETKEPRGQGEQTVITSQKTYFLDTGEKVNKVNSADFLIIKKNLVIRKVEPFFSKPFIVDIKTLFDGLKNLALCLAMLVALPTMQAMAALTYDHRFFVVAFTWAALVVIIMLAGYNFIWLYKTMEAKPKSKVLDKAAWFVTFLIVAFIFFCAIVITYPKLVLSTAGSSSVIDATNATPNEVPTPLLNNLCSKS
ncbi:hypothetical protein SAMN04490190_0836 [Pseudomonas libanensis]|uniref:Uncharacterized protein n=1 Tax=Pseudomonas libanensis TaxID=75588 RepID=A0A0R2YJL0_9PSED|nr:hypothetical protein [Pseudomonas libanensis]KRP45422.1 hypothetical protein TU73_13555 [Pseudomonas libanensis]SDK63840.1 hypothetical protein SAMN04490190_0836 [Pseudomonas libanensis]